MPSFLYISPLATSGIYTLSLHDALPILRRRDGHFLAILNGRLDEDFRERKSILGQVVIPQGAGDIGSVCEQHAPIPRRNRSEEHTSELQSHVNLVCRLLLEKKKSNLFRD